MKIDLKRLTWLILPLAVLALGLIITHSLWRQAEREARQVLEAEFQSRVRLFARHVEGRLHANVQVLRGAAGLFAASREVGRQEFRDYVEALRLAQHYPGIQGVGYSLWLSPRDLPAHVAAIRAEGFPNYGVHPEGERAAYTSIVYLEPFSGRNLRAFGFDMHSEPIRRAAMEQARDSGEAALSGKVLLLQETESDVQSGFLLYLPVYRGARETLEQRRANLLGWAYSPLRMGDMVRGVIEADGLRDLLAGLDLEIYDGSRPTFQGLMYDSDHRASLDTQEGFFQMRVLLGVAGHSWTLHASSLRDFDARLELHAARQIVVTGVTLSLGLALLLGAMARGRGRVLEALEAKETALERLAASEETYRTLYESMTQGVFYQAADGRLLDCNPATLELFGVSREQFLGRTCESTQWRAVFEDGSVVAPDQYPSALAIASGRPVRDVVVGLHNPVKGRFVWMLINAIPQFRPEESEPYQAFVTLQDISDRRETESALRESEAKYRLVTENALEWVFWSAPDGRAIYNSPSCETLTGYTPEEFMHDPGLLLRLLHPDDQPKYASHLDESRSAHAHEGVEELELRIRRRDGEERWIAHACRPMYDQQGRHLGNRGSNRDITERKRLEAELESHRQHLEELVEDRTRELHLALTAAEAGNLAKTRFLANMSHELRTPLNAIIGMTHLARRASSEEAVRGKLGTALDAARRLLDLINDILDLARIDQGGLSLASQRFSLAGLLDDLLPDFQRQAEARGLVLEAQLAGDPPTDYLGDPAQLSRILGNLLDNAIKFSDQGRIQLRIRVQSLSDDGVLLRFEVDDQGPGIAPEDQAHLFQPFVQVDASATRRHGGAGLGLALCRQLARLMGGETGVSSVLGQGSVFWFTCRLKPYLAGVHLGAEHPSLEQLTRLLELDDLGSLALFHNLRPELAANLDAQTLEALASAMERYDFAGALELLREAEG